jgi:hypothetical protein
MQHKRRTNGYGNSDLWKGLAAGLVAGLVASWTINRFQDVWSKLAEGIEALSHNEFRDVWDGFTEGREESFDIRGSKPSPSLEVPEVKEKTRAARLCST